MDPAVQWARSSWAAASVNAGDGRLCCPSAGKGFSEEATETSDGVRRGVERRSCEVFGSAASGHPGAPSAEETGLSEMAVLAMDFGARVGDHPNRDHRGGRLDDHSDGYPSFDGIHFCWAMANAVGGLLDCLYELGVIGFFEGFVNVVGGLGSLSALETGFFSVATATTIRWVFALADRDCAPCGKVKGSFFWKSSASDLEVTSCPKA
jgi:hypothetical protein